MLPLRRLALDPSTRYVGWAFVNEREEPQAGYWDFHRLDYHSTLRALYKNIITAIMVLDPTMLVVENQITARNGRTIRMLSEVVGVCKIAALIEDVPVIEIPAVTVRRLIIPAGVTSDKQSLADELHRRYPSLTIPNTKEFDASDALGLAVATPYYLAEQEGGGRRERRAPRRGQH